MIKNICEKCETEVKKDYKLCWKCYKKEQENVGKKNKGDWVKNLNKEEGAKELNLSIEKVPTWVWTLVMGFILGAWIL